MEDEGVQAGEIEPVTWMLPLLMVERGVRSASAEPGELLLRGRSPEPARRHPDESRQRAARLGLSDDYDNLQRHAADPALRVGRTRPPDAITISHTLADLPPSHEQPGRRA